MVVLVASEKTYKIICVLRALKRPNSELLKKGYVVRPESRYKAARAVKKVLPNTKF